MTFIDHYPQQQNSVAWKLFSVVSFGTAFAGLTGGLYFIDMPGLAKAYFAVIALLLIQSCFTLAKTLRDEHEDGRFINRIEKAKTEKLLADPAGRP